MPGRAILVLMSLIVVDGRFNVGRSLGEYDHSSPPYIITYGPHAADYKNTSVHMDPGHRQLLDIAHKWLGFGEKLGYNWTGREILCNCTSSDCGDKEILKVLHLSGFRRTCVGLACYRQKTTILTANNVWKREDHLGCYGGDKADHDTFNKTMGVMCRSTARLNISCCDHSYCNPDIPVEFPAEDRSMEKKITHFVRLDYVMIGFMCMMCALMCSCMIMTLWCPRVPMKVRRAIFACLAWLPLPRVLNIRETNIDDQQPMLEVHPGGGTATATSAATRTPGVETQQTMVSNTRGPLSGLIEDLDTSNSGSGSGLPLLTQRTIARQIELKREIGQGRFGEVWLGHWRGQNVAVKIFSSRDERSWFREVETFQTHMLRHPNVLQFIASDNKDTGMIIQLWLITEFHSFGSLYDFLSKEPIDTLTMVQLVRSLANGLSYLHTEIPGNPGKPAIAHRDMKSKNVLVKKDLTCVVADLGLAVRLEHGQLNLPDNTKCGTVRYLAPEVLDDAMESSMFDSYRYGDIYALGLIIWEVARRTEFPEGSVAEFEDSLPYFDTVSRDPTLEEMRQVVAVQGVRPEKSEHWEDNTVLSETWRVMKECWTSQPLSRLTATNVRIAMDRLAKRFDMELQM